MDTHQVDCNLRRQAAITISEKLWRYSQLNKALKLCIDRELSLHEELPSLISNEISKLPVPEPVKEELLFIVGMMGLDIWDFKCRLDEAYNEGAETSPENSVFQPEPSIWVDYICWSNCGRLDCRETMRALYMANILPINAATWMELCCLCVDGSVSDCWSRISRENRLDLSSHSVIARRQINSTDFVSDIVIGIYWVTLSDPEIMAETHETLQHMPNGIFNINRSFEEDMFTYAFSTRQDFAVEYFWELLNDEQRKRAIDLICEKIISNDPSAEYIKKLFYSDDTIHIRSLTFFFKQLSFYDYDKVRIRILGSGFVLRELLHWAYYNSFMTTIKEAWSYHESIDYAPVITALCLYIYDSKEYQFAERDVHYRRIFYEIWKENPRNLKNSIHYEVIFEMMWDREEVALFNCILRDEELRDRRNEFISMLAPLYDPAETSDEFYHVFVEHLLQNDAERALFENEVFGAYEE